MADLASALALRPNAVLVAPPGSGKTTRVPPALLESGLAGGEGGGRILVLQPRRVAARLAAKRIAWERGENLGGIVGYRTRFEGRVSQQTRIEIITEGLLLRRLQADPFIEGVAAVVLDEFHERSLNLDLSLALLREVQGAGRDDLRIVVMSATLDPDPVVEFLGGADSCSLFRSEGRTFPVTLEFDPRPTGRRLDERVASAVRSGLKGSDRGHSLVFLPSVAEIERVRGLLEQGELPKGVVVLPLHGSLPPAQQDAALAPSAVRKVVLATNIAETSVTLDGVTRVIDSGLAVVPRFDPSCGATSLGRERIARDSADQRAGRAGRTGPGVCHRMWTASEDAGLARATLPAIRRSDLTSALLQLASWGTKPEAFGWFETPPIGSLEAAMELLSQLGAMHDGRLMPLGVALAALPTHPRMGRVLLAAADLGVLATAATAVALCEGRELLHRDVRTPPGEDDLEFRLRLVAESEAARRPIRGVRGSALSELRRVRDQLMRVVESADPSAAWGLPDVAPLTSAAPPLLRALAAGFPDRIGLLRPGAAERYQLASGQGARLGTGSGSTGQRVVLALALDAGRASGRRESWIRLAASLDPAWVSLEEADELVFDESAEAVVGRRVWRYRALIFRSQPPQSPVAPARQGAVLAQAAGRLALDELLTIDAESEALLGRVATLAGLRPELGLPDLQSLAPLLPSLCAGRRSFAQLRKAALKPAILELLSWDQRRALDDDLPERIEVPSGRFVRLQYSRSGDPPVLAARIQQLFGMKETPRLAGGRLPVLVHLLAPNGRPAQVTMDLASFWASTWQEVRKDLRGRYPKHSWPEDPSEAVAEDRPRRKARKPR